MTYQIKFVVPLWRLLPFWVFKNLSICKAFRNFKPPASSHYLLYARTQLMLRWRWVQKCLQFIISLIMDSCGSLFWPTIGLKARVVHPCMFGYFGSYKSWWITLKGYLGGGSGLISLGRNVNLEVSNSIIYIISLWSFWVV